MGRGEGELLAVGGLEGRLERAPRGLVVGVWPVGQRHHEVEALAEEAAIGEAAHGGGVELEARVRHDGARLVLEPPERRLEGREAALVEAQAHRRHAVDAGRGHEQAEGRGDPRRRRADHAGEAELLRDGPGVHRARAAVASSA
jgi:hypothetical protein